MAHHADQRLAEPVPIAGASDDAERMGRLCDREDVTCEEIGLWLKLWHLAGGSSRQVEIRPAQHFGWFGYRDARKFRDRLHSLAVAGLAAVSKSGFVRGVWLVRPRDPLIAAWLTHDVRQRTLFDVDETLPISGQPRLADVPAAPPKRGPRRGEKSSTSRPVVMPGSGQLHLDPATRPIQSDQISSRRRDKRPKDRKTENAPSAPAGDTAAPPTVGGAETCGNDQGSPCARLARATDTDPPNAQLTDKTDALEQDSERSGRLRTSEDLGIGSAQQKRRAKGNLVIHEPKPKGPQSIGSILAETDVVEAVKRQAATEERTRRMNADRCFKLLVQVLGKTAQREKELIDRIIKRLLDPADPLTLDEVVLCVDWLNDQTRCGAGKSLIRNPAAYLNHRLVRVRRKEINRRGTESAEDEGTRTTEITPRRKR